MKSIDKALFFQFSKIQMSGNSKEYVLIIIQLVVLVHLLKVPIKG